ncbi:hypothetical protein IMZ11_30030 [Microtetraspora sp. AC03309]|uniref:hypothetical protein n=1 Tax=Microtetraspora sp. AC03309 TaxID=2779376 RepID=UPI001E367A25|nr:hypothetical protein [Microtetraspora sp. AC03309]MCC5579870.1 hypothetical protein [Microtetraspora sp. AC03309]
MPKFKRLAGLLAVGATMAAGAVALGAATTTTASASVIQTGGCGGGCGSWGGNGRGWNRNTNNKHQSQHNQQNQHQEQTQFLINDVVIPEDENLAPTSTTTSSSNGRDIIREFRVLD